MNDSLLSGHAAARRLRPQRVPLDIHEYGNPQIVEPTLSPSVRVGTCGIHECSRYLWTVDRVVLICSPTTRKAKKYIPETKFEEKP